MGGFDVRIPHGLYRNSLEDDCQTDRGHEHEVESIHDIDGPFHSQPMTSYPEQECQDRGFDECQDRIVHSLQYETPVIGSLGVLIESIRIGGRESDEGIFVVYTGDLSQ